MRKSMIFVVAFASLGILADAGAAKSVNISGKHSAAELKNACAAVNGEYNTFEGGGWGCTNNNCDGKGGKCTVGCDIYGKCTGSVPGQFAGGGIAGILKGTVGKSGAGTLQH
jgi:hypothetical protein